MGCPEPLAVGLARALAISMQITGAPTWATLGAVIGIIVLLLCVLGLVGVLPMSGTIVFGLLAALAIARLV